MLYQSGDEGMLHALLCNLPDLVDDIPLQEMPVPSKQSTKEAIPETPSRATSWDEAKSEATDELSASQAWTSASAGASVTSQSWTAVASSTTSESVPSPGTSPTLLPLAPNPPAEPPRLDVNMDSTLEFPPLDPASPLSHNSSYADEKVNMGASVTSSAVDVESRPPRKLPLALTALLRQADALHQKHPMSSLQTASIMGPQSVIFTWCETGSKSPPPKDANADTRTSVQEVHWESAGQDLISDNMAEKMVLHPELVVRPWRDEDEEEAEREAEMARANRQKREVDRKQRARRNDPGLFGAIAGNKGSVIVVGGMVVVVALGVVIAVYGKNGEWKKWIGRSSWLPKRTPA
jgi:TBC1 domain family member 20